MATFRIVLIQCTAVVVLSKTHATQKTITRPGLVCLTAAVACQTRRRARAGAERFLADHVQVALLWAWEFRVPDRSWRLVPAIPSEPSASVSACAPAPGLPGPGGLWRCAYALCARPRETESVRQLSSSHPAGDLDSLFRGVGVAVLIVATCTRADHTCRGVHPGVVGTAGGDGRRGLLVCVCGFSRTSRLGCGGRA